MRGEGGGDGAHRANGEDVCLIDLEQGIKRVEGQGHGEEERGAGGGSDGPMNCSRSGREKKVEIVRLYGLRWRREGG